MRRTIAMIVAVAVVSALSGCGGSRSQPAAANNPPPTGGPPPPAGPPTDFTAFVNQQLMQPQPAFGTAPAATDALSTNLQLGSASAFAAVTFGTGDALPSGVYQAATACVQAGQAACDPGSSADLNSTLN